MAIATELRTVTVNAAFLQEIKEVNEELWTLLDEVRRLCERAERIRLHRRRVVVLLGQLRDQLAMHFALEEAYGYFDDPLFVAPHLGARAASLRGDHRHLYLAITGLVEFVEGLHARGRLVDQSDEIVVRFAAFDSRFQEHEQRENELILEAYDEDLGVGD